MPDYSSQSGSSAASSPAPRSELSGGAARTQNPAVLLVEDNPETAKVMRIMLERLGCQVTVVGDGPAAIDVFSHSPPALVLMDLDLPGMDGFEILQRLKALQSVEEGFPTVWAVSAHLYALIAPKVTAAGFDDYIEKPFNLTVFNQRVCTVLGLNQP